MRHLRQPEARPMATAAENRRKRRMTARAKWILVVALVAVITVASVVTVVANTADVTVTDDGAVYEFSMLGVNPSSILSRAQTEGMAPLSDIDTYDFDEMTGVLTVHRAVRLSVSDLGGTNVYVAPKHTSLGEVLAANGCSVGQNDTVEPALETELLADTTASVTRMNRVTVEADGERTRREILGGTVADALREAGVTLGEKDTVTPAADAPLTDGLRVYVGRWVDVSVSADGRTVPYAGPANSWNDVLTALDISVAPEDRLSISGEPVEAAARVLTGSGLRVQRITTEEYVSVEDVPFETEYEYTDALLKDRTEQVTEGVNGERRAVYRRTYVDGIQESDVLIEEEVLTPAVNAVVRVGTLGPSGDVGTSGGVFVDSSGQTVSFLRSLTGSCTAYYDVFNYGHGAIGEPTVRGNVAVNPYIIPYGSLMYITAVDGSWDYGYAMATDTGGALMEGTALVDLYYDTYEECTAFGRRDMIVYILREGWGN